MYAKDIKKRGKQKMENEPEQKKKGKKGETDRTAQSGPTSPAHLQPATRTVISFFCFSDVWDPPCQHLLLQTFPLTGNGTSPE
jgi:hypothetical protein